ncbi:MAG: preprotein translocase subunit SecE [Actinomycetota bacterium]
MVAFVPSAIGDGAARLGPLDDVRGSRLGAATGRVRGRRQEGSDLCCVDGTNGRGCRRLACAQGRPFAHHLLSGTSRSPLRSFDRLPGRPSRNPSGDGHRSGLLLLRVGAHTVPISSSFRPLALRRIRSEAYLSRLTISQKRCPDGGVISEPQIGRCNPILSRGPRGAREVSWPTGKELFAYSMVVLLAVAVLGYLVFALDQLFLRTILRLFGR